MRCAKTILGLSLLGLATPLAFGQTATTMVRRGDPIIGVGGIDRVTDIRILDSRMWIAVVDSDVRDNARNQCVLRSGFLALREGMAIPDPPGATLASGAGPFASFAVTSRGDLAMHLRARVGTTQAAGVFWNFTKLAYIDEVIAVSGLGPNSIWGRTETLKVAGNDTVIVLCEVDDTAIGGTRNDALLRFRVDAQGNVIEKTLLATQGQFLDAFGTTVETLGSVGGQPEHCLAANARGDYLLPVQLLGRKMMLLNMETVLAEDATPSPVAGRNWNNNAFTLAKAALNDRGEHVFTGTLIPNGDASEPTNFLIVKNGEKFVQSGEVIPALSTGGVGKLTPMVALSNKGDVFWRASLDRSAFVRNYTPLVQETVTVVNGNLVTQLSGADNCFSISPEGRFFVGRVILQGLGDAVVFIDFGLVREREGCLGVNSGSLQHLSGEARLGQPLRLGLTDGPAPGALPILIASRTPRLSADGCGVPTPFGELLLGPPILNTVILPAWDGVNPSQLTTPIPNNVALVDAVFYVQGAFRSTTQPATFRLTNALQIEIGPP